MDTRPAWVPEWLWAQYQEIRYWQTRPHVHDAEYSARVIQRLDAIVASSECAPVWRAMAARKDELDERSKASALFGQDFRYGAILLSIAQHAEGIDPSEAFSASDRRRTGAAIAKLARELHKALAEVDVGQGLPTDFFGPMMDYADSQLEAYTREYAQDIAVMKLSPKQVTEHAKTWSSGITYALTEYGGSLRAIEAGAMEWSKSSPPVARVRSPNAARLYFIRQMTAEMRHHFNTPLREQVAALTRVLFDCDMDADTVAKLAP